jgi:hypothetical protein
MVRHGVTLLRRLPHAALTRLPALAVEGFKVRMDLMATARGKRLAGPTAWPCCVFLTVKEHPRRVPELNR